MKTILLVSVLALAAVPAAIAPTQAATMIVKTNDHLHMKSYCRTKMVTHWRHHRKVVEKVKVCG